MSWTKRQLVVKAYASLGVADYVYDLSAEELRDACVDLDAMIASWKSINISYNMSDSPDTADINADSGLPAFANQAVYLNLAPLLALPLGRQLPASLLVGAKRAYTELLKNAINPPQNKQFPGTLPRGAGQKSWDWPYLNPPIDQLETGPEGQLDILN